ncbi:alginate export family protein, partial [bacterium]|nr:alginate export family protein [bacterium]
WNKPIHLKAGRQEMIYGSQRLIGAVGWSNVGRSFDGIKWTIGRTNQVDFFGMMINESSTPGVIAGQEDADNRFFGAYYKHRSQPEYTLDIYGLYESNLNETVAGSNDLDRATLGTYNRGKFSSNLAFETEVAVQLGKRRGQDVRAFMLTGSLNYTFPSTRRPSLLIGYDYLSGMDESDSDYKVFDTLFATNHKYYGFMDYFVNIPVHTNGQGLQDFMFKARIPLSSKWNFDAHFHNFRAAKGSVKDFGNEFDLILNYQYNSAASFVLGLGFFAPGDLIKQRFGDGDVGIWSYSTLLVTF